MTKITASQNTVVPPVHLAVHGLLLLKVEINKEK